MRVTVVDYGAGNLKSVETALRFLSADFTVSADPGDVIRADKVIFPGVGEAAAAMATLKKTGLGEALALFHRGGRPLLGICLGSQIVLDRSEESDTACLGLVPGTARLFPKQPGFKVPHMGWNRVRPLRPHPLFAGVPESASFYFVHSYYPEPEAKEDRIAATDYVIPFTSALARDNLCAVQFHPEKSGRVGLRMLGNFLAMN
ncbi:MAG: imidazole glycerol phosphate synthase subunit HisH [Spirochaetales bacterium]|nr:imidazole glycerol phosphate synthase subunit HisH [Spirochaetales bacterium]